MNLLSPSMMQFIVSSMFIQLVLQMCGACPAGFKLREGKCFETTICNPGEGYRLGDGSMTNPKDTCYKCPNGTYNRDRIDTAKLDFQLVDVCRTIDCSCGHDGTIIENDDNCEKGEEKICICDREHLFYGRDPLACQRMEDQSIISRIERPGNELTNSGEVKRCQKGYFKATADLSICKPHSSCPAEAGLQVRVEGTATSDALCENATDLPSSREITSYPPIDEIVINNAAHPTEEEPGMPGYVYAIMAVVLILVIITICVCAYRHPEHFPCLRSLIEKMKQRHLRRNEFDAPRNEHSMPIYQDLNEVVVDQCQPNDENADLSEPSSDLPSYIRNDISTPGTVGNLDSCGSETSLLKVDRSHGSGRPTGRVAPMKQESTNQVTQPSNLASPSEDDRGELMVSGQRARDVDEPFSEQLDSELGEQ